VVLQLRGGSFRSGVPGLPHVGGPAADIRSAGSAFRARARVCVTVAGGRTVQWRDGEDYREFQRQLVCYLRRWSRPTELMLDRSMRRS
jgi:hypothetical protein